MFINFDFGFGDINDYTIEIQLGNQIIQKQTLEVPAIVAKQQFIQLAQQIAYDKRPMQIRCSKMTYTEEDKPTEEWITFSNNTFIAEFGE